MTLIDWKVTKVKMREYIIKYMKHEEECLKTDLIYALEDQNLLTWQAEHFVKMALHDGIIMEGPNKFSIKLTVHNPYPTLEEIENSKSANGGYTKAQLAQWGISWPPEKGWLSNLKKQARIRQAMMEYGDLD